MIHNSAASRNAKIKNQISSIGHLYNFTFLIVILQFGFSYFIFLAQKLQKYIGNTILIPKWIWDLAFLAISYTVTLLHLLEKESHVCRSFWR